MRHITTWFHTDDDGRGEYAQVRGNPLSDEFRDVYRRCVALYFISARRANPDAKLTLYVNQPWADTTKIARETASLLDKLGVEIDIIEYSANIPNSFTEKWRNQFYVLDVLKAALEKMQSEDVLTILDSDVVWSVGDKANLLWSAIKENNIVAMPLNYPLDQRENGLSAVELAALLGADDAIPYMGGEFVGVSSCGGRLVLENAVVAFRALMNRHLENHEIAFEEAHVLSAAYARLSASTIPPGIIGRVWTQPLKFRNVNTSDLDLALWHVPAEKRYGLRRLYKLVQRVGVDSVLQIPDEKWIQLVTRHLGIPRNSPVKWVSDVSFAIWRRVSMHRR